MSRLTRRTVVAGALAAGALPRRLRADEAETESHGLSIYGDLKYPPDFTHFSYVRPDAPKGGAFSSTLNQTIGNQAFETFSSFNIFILKGEGAAGVPLTFDTLMTRALDEPDGMYGLAARAVRRSADGLTYRFLMRPEARWHDGSRLTARDAAFSLGIIKSKGHPLFAQLLRDMREAVAESDEVLTVRFAPGRSRDLPLTVAGMPILSEAYYKVKNFEEATLEPPLGSGPYKIGRFEPGRFVEVERVKDYWGADLPVNRGQGNFDTIRYEYFRDRTVALEGFKARTYTFREEFTARDWARAYDFPAVLDGRVKRDIVPDDSPSGAQGWYFNTRREKFRDPRIREAIGLCFDFEWTNANVMFDTYVRTRSFFEGSDLVASGPPTPEELALLDPFRDKLPAELLFAEPYQPPVSDKSGQDRRLLSRAAQLLKEAGCTRGPAGMKLANGQPLDIEFLDNNPALHPHTQPFIKNLKLVGIEARLRTVDAVQMQRRTDDFDFDMITRRYAFSATPGEAIRNVFGSEAANTKGSRNLAGIADPVVDALVDKVLTAETRAAMTVAAKALDRVLRAGRYWVPMWTSRKHHFAYWDVYGRPAEKPRYARGVPDTWWYDQEKAKRIGL